MNILDAFSGDTPQELCSKMKDIIAYAPTNPLISDPLISKCMEVCKDEQCKANIEPPPTCTKCCEFAQTLEGEQQLAAAAYCKLWCNSHSDGDDNSLMCDTILTDNISPADIIAKIVNMQAELDRVKKATDCSLDDDGNCFYKSSNWTGVICVFILMALLIAVISFAMSTK
jgi:hypothetical protein